MTDLATLDATAQAELVRSGAASPVEMVEAAIARIDSVDAQINCIVHRRYEEALAEAADPALAGPFRGVPMVVKDLDGWLAGSPYRAGSRFLADGRFVPTESSELISRFQGAGLVIVAKASTPELGLVVSAEPAAFGPTRNPWDTGRSVGGSSGGSAAAVASGMVPVGHAGDGGGSIRVPASECGLIGLKPSRGRVTTGPQISEAWAGLVQRFCVVRSVRDAAALLDAVHGGMVGDWYEAPPPTRTYVSALGAGDVGPLRIGVLTSRPRAEGETHPACVAAARRTADALADLGHDVVDDDVVPLDDPALSMAILTCLPVWVAHEIDEYGKLVGRPASAEDLEPHTWQIAEMGRAVSATDYFAGLETLHRWARAVVNWWSDFDLLLTPTLTEPPPRIGDLVPTADNPLNAVMRTADLISFVQPFNVTGQPAISLPVSLHDGVPIGAQLVGAPYREDVLLQVAAQLESKIGWNEGAQPTVHA